MNPKTSENALIYASVSTLLSYDRVSYMVQVSAIVRGTFAENSPAGAAWMARGVKTYCEAVALSASATEHVVMVG